MDKWNKQGGSSRDGIFKPKRRKPRPAGEIRPLEFLKESDSVSFKFVPQRTPTPEFGQFGDRVEWIFDDIPDIKLIPEIKDSTYDYIPTNTVKPVTDNTRPELDKFREEKSYDLVPYAVTDIYEIIVKWQDLTITIMPGQAYQAREGTTSEQFDYALVILSPVAISIAGNSASTINAIYGFGSSNDYQIIQSLYLWIIQIMESSIDRIVTDGTGQNNDPILSQLVRSVNAIPLPPIEFTYNSIQHGLFGGLGLQVSQICLSAIDKLLLFDSQSKPNELAYQCLYAGDRMMVCLPQIVDPSDPVVDYRFVAIFISGSGLRLGGFDAANHTSNQVTPYDLAQFDYGFDIINPMATSWQGIDPRGELSPPDYPNHTGMYWQASYLEYGLININNTNYSAYALNFFKEDGSFVSTPKMSPVLASNMSWRGGEKWQSDFYSTNLTSDFNSYQILPLQSILYSSPGFLFLGLLETIIFSGDLTVAFSQTLFNQNQDKIVKRDRYVLNTKTTETLTIVSESDFLPNDSGYYEKGENYSDNWIVKSLYEERFLPPTPGLSSGGRIQKTLYSEYYQKSVWISGQLEMVLVQKKPYALVAISEEDFYLGM